MTWTPKQHLEHQKILKRMEREYKPVRKKKVRGKVDDLSPATSAKPDAGQRKKKKVRRK